MRGSVRRREQLLQAGNKGQGLAGAHLATRLSLQLPQQVSQLPILPLQDPQPPSLCLPHLILQ